MKMNKIYEEKKVDKLMFLFLVIIPFIFTYINYKTNKSVLLSIIPAVYFISSRDYYLPFLGDSVLPTGLLEEKTPTNYDMEVKVELPENTKIIYWASENGKENRTPWEAYNKYENSGITSSNKKGIATLKIRTPGKYMKPMLFGTKYLKPHLHYRIIKTNGMLGRVETVYV